MNYVKNTQLEKEMDLIVTRYVGLYIRGNALRLMQQVSFQFTKLE